MSKIKLKTFVIETFDGHCYFNFFTKAINHKKALRSLETKSLDYRKLCHSDSDLTIKIKAIK